VSLTFEEGKAGKRKRLVVEGRTLYAYFKKLVTKDINLPPGQDSYDSWVPMVSGRVLAASGRHAGHTIWQDLGDGWEGRVEVVQPKTPRRVHPEDRVCQECRVFDVNTGKDMFTKKTHHYMNGSLSELEWEINAEAETRGAAPLTENNVGWCWRTKSLVAKNAPACTDQFVEK
jgi:hypothetical protein